MSAGDTATEKTVRLESRWSQSWCVDALTQVGVSAEEAVVVADSLLNASLRGVDSHGLTLLPLYIERVRSGQIVPGRRSLIRREEETTAVLDGQHGVGPVLACEAMDRATEKASRYGLGAVSLLNSNYIGALAFYAVRPCASGMVGLCTANATPRVAPHGGSQGLHGTNPLAYAAPMNGGTAPLVFDISTERRPRRRANRTRDTATHGIDSTLWMRILRARHRSGAFRRPRPLRPACPLSGRRDAADAAGSGSRPGQEHGIPI